ncbi:PHA/PHB synthase family protein [Yoonia algicola]|uniref:Alpha/beta fold hydrolase n=1 Tax=Yoonia algicola TaxID=3137368 RepID=A0AAN0M8U0_9RHOB
MSKSNTAEQTGFGSAFPVNPDALDRSLHATAARFTAGLSPIALSQAWWDWAAHLAASPGHRAELWASAATKTAAVLSGPAAGGYAEKAQSDVRFDDEAWRSWPFSFWAASHKAQEEWWAEAVTGLRGQSSAHEKVNAFAVRQMLDMASPSNFMATNPEVQRQTLREGGQNLVRGARHLHEDFEQLRSGEPAPELSAFVVGDTVAATPGDVVFRNDLIELIRYTPTTEKVHPEPILLIPAWIMKYYILDLSPHNSLVRFLVDQGHTVYCISWRNPGPDDRDLGMDDYIDHGVMAALDAIGRDCPETQVHATGYCLGGTLLSIAAAAMGRDGDDRLASVSLLAAQADFTEAGELSLFINDSQLALLEDMMWKEGVLKAEQMAGTFQLLKSNDLIWSRMLRDYMMGERSEPNDLMAWNADTTRMPFRMHAEYLRRLYLNNDLAEGRFEVRGKPVSLSDIRVPIFAVGTERDHVAPWKSAYKIQALTDTEVTFVLASGGHNGGIVSEPGHPYRHFRIHTTPDHAAFVSADAWAELAERHEGSWWTAWAGWLGERSLTPIKASKPKLAMLCAAPGSYVLQD